MKNKIVQIFISLNVYCLHFVEQHWLKNSALSPQGKYSYSLSIFLIVHSSITLLVGQYYEDLSVRLIIGIGCLLNLALSLVFKQEISESVKGYHFTFYPKYSAVFLIWLATGIVCLLLLVFGK